MGHHPRKILDKLPPSGSPFDPSSSQIGFVSRLFVATTLPHSAPTDNEFTRSNGLYRLCLLAPREVGLPYGRYPRLTLAWMITEAVKRKTPLLPLPPSLSNFAHKLGVTPSSGLKGTLIGLRDQLIRVTSLTIVCLELSPSANSLPMAFRRVGGVHLVKQCLPWWDEAPGGQDPFILLSQDFYEEIIAHPIPIDLNVIRSLRSPLEIDTYMWLTYRSFRAGRLARPETIPWEALSKQFGASYAEVRVFRFRFIEAIKNIIKVYPEIRLRATKAGLVLLPYPSHIRARRDLR